VLFYYGGWDHVAKRENLVNIREPIPDPSLKKGREKYIDIFRLRNDFGIFLMEYWRMSLRIF